MVLPAPRPGLVVRYDFVWSREFAKGLQEGKDRPACIAVATDPAAEPQFVVLLPITHAEPTGDTVGIEIPARVRAALGLDDERSWIIVSEYNVDSWPNAGLRPVRDGRFDYGFIPPRLFSSVRQLFLDLAKAGRSKATRR
jgi:hypothetical protein